MTSLTAQWFAESSRIRVFRIYGKKVALWGMVSVAALLLLDYISSTLIRHVTPLQDVIVHGGDSLSRAAVEKALAEVRGENLLSLDVEQWRQKLTALPGIEQVQVRRKLPHTLQVSLTSSQPLARWHDGSFLIDAQGGRFSGRADGALPIFSGDEQQLAKMVAFYQHAQTVLPQGMAQLELDARGDWRVFLTDGILLYLGQDPLPQLRRYAHHAPALHRQIAGVQMVDMRYPHGFSVQLQKEEK
ncbi:MAG: cell division protein FtsQ/DivIB [Proteobacteria bacterium]|nr:cell division protein FtsQ/DivIB [Pseudomonadota bacterium]